MALPAWDATLMSAGGFLYGPLYRAAFPGARLEQAVRRRGALLLAREDGDALVTVRQSATGVLSLQINGRLGRAEALIWSCTFFTARQTMRSLGMLSLVPNTSGALSFP